MRQNTTITPLLLALFAVCGLCVAGNPAHAQKKPAGPRHEQMDYGTFLTASIQAPQPKKNNAMKGIVIPLGKDKAAVCFDIDLVRISAGWLPAAPGPWDRPSPRMADFLQLRGTPFDGSHGSWPALKGTQVFGTGPAPGWARPGTSDFTDPRKEPYGPLPSSWARYKGLYRNGDQIVLSYAVGACPVLESPGVLVRDDWTLFSRTFNLGPTPVPLTLLVAEVEGGKGQVTDGIATLGNAGLRAGLVNAPAGAALHVEAGKMLLKLPACTGPVAFRLLLAATPKTGTLDGFKAHLLKATECLTWLPSPGAVPPNGRKPSPPREPWVKGPGPTSSIR